MFAGPIFQPLVSLPGDISRLLDAERLEGHRLVKRLADEWEDGTNRFDQPGEIALEARLAGDLVAVGGLNRDPYLDDPEVGRLRHVYVSPEARGSGVGRNLVEALVWHARLTFSRVRLRTVTTDGSRFYVALGFEEVDEPEATHVWRFHG
jgi:N-acetylglutamate synthase-like GNAT family acetyltransferase